MPADNTGRLFQVTENINDQITEVFDAHPDMTGAGTSNIRDILVRQLGSTIDGNFFPDGSVPETLFESNPTINA